MTPVRDPVAGTQDATRRRFARRQWARRWLAWRPVVASVLALLLTGGVVWLLFFSTVLAVAGVEVEGTSYLRSPQVVRVAGVPTGAPLARVDLDAIARRVSTLPAVRDVEVTRQWPDRVQIEVTERVPVAVVERGETYRGLDADGVVFRDFDQRPGSLPLITVGDGVEQEALREAAGVVTVLRADIARLVDHVEVETVDRIMLVLRDRRRVLWGNAEQAADKARVLEVLLDQKAQWYDVSVPGQPTTRG